MIPASHEEEFGFEPFADTPVYQQVHSDIIAGWLKLLRAKNEGSPARRVLDLATGKGTIPRLVLENWPQDWPAPQLVCLDQANEALSAAREELKSSSAVNPEFVNASIEDFSLEPESIDFCTWGNGIHYLDAAHQEKAIENIRNTLRAGGWFAFNTAFHLEGRPERTHAFYNHQIRTAVRSLAGIERDKSVKMPAAAYLSRAHYQELLQKKGFELMETREITGPLNLDAMEKISGFRHYAAGALRGYPPDIAARALKAAVAPAMAAHGELDADGNPFVARTWLAIAARRTE